MTVHLVDYENGKDHLYSAIKQWKTGDILHVFGTPTNLFFCKECPIEILSACLQGQRPLSTYINPFQFKQAMDCMANIVLLKELSMHTNADFKIYSRDRDWTNMSVNLSTWRERLKLLREDYGTIQLQLTQGSKMQEYIAEIVLCLLGNKPQHMYIYFNYFGSPCCKICSMLQNSDITDNYELSTDPEKSNAFYLNKK